MARKKRSISETATEFIEDSAAVVEAAEEKQASPDLVARLSRIFEQAGVLGYILRDASTATINLKEPEKIVEYAILGSQTLESSQEIGQLFNLGEFRDALVEGTNMKALCLMIGENKINIFMEKDVDEADILNSITQ